MGSGELLKHLAIWPLATLVLFIVVPFIYIGLRNMLSRNQDE